jgi:hypothetical protein
VGPGGAVPFEIAADFAARIVVVDPDVRVLQARRKNTQTTLAE